MGIEKIQAHHWQAIASVPKITLKNTLQKQGQTGKN